MGKGDYKINLYAGADYGFDSKYGKEFSTGVGPGYGTSSGVFGITTDPRTANQLQAVSNKLNTGAKVVEITGIAMQTLDMIPKQHYKEIERLKKLVGAEMTFHGPLVEPSGVGQNGFDPVMKKQAEHQMWSAVDRAHDLDPKGNVVVTLHSSNGLPMPETWTKDEKGKTQLSGIFVVNEDTGRVGSLPRAEANYFEGKKEYKVEDRLDEINKETWFGEISNVNLSADRARNVFSRINEEKKQTQNLDLKKLYESYDTPEGQKMLKSLDPETQRVAREIMSNITSADVLAKDSLRMFTKVFNDAYSYAEKLKDEKEKTNIMRKLDEVKRQMTPAVNEYKSNSRNPDAVEEVTEAISTGLGTLKDINPQTWKPLKDFAIEQAADTFSQVAVNSYKKYKDTSPIISIENPPVGMGLSRAEDLKELIKVSREKFVKKMKDEGMSEKSAREEAEKIIGATWDVGHINMIRGYGYGSKDVVEESKKIAPYVKHVHLSDNFGLEHTELPMGMGNVPTKEILALSEKFREAKKIVETGGWFGPQGFGNRTPLVETFRAFNSPIYAMELGPSWQGGANNYGSYFSGFGRYLPEQHFSIYGAGFSNLPPELGGQTAGRSRASGAPID